MTGLGYTRKIYTQKDMSAKTKDAPRNGKRVCALCGKEYESSAPNQKYCSLMCREAARKADRRAFDEANPNYRKEYMREYRKRQKERAKNRC